MCLVGYHDVAVALAPSCYEKRTVMPGGFRIKLCAHVLAREKRKTSARGRVRGKRMRAACPHARRKPNACMPKGERGGVLFSPEIETGRSCLFDRLVGRSFAM